MLSRLISNSWSNGASASVSLIFELYTRISYFFWISLMCQFAEVRVGQHASRVLIYQVEFRSIFLTRDIVLYS